MKVECKLTDYRDRVNYREDVVIIRRPWNGFNSVEIEIEGKTVEVMADELIDAVNACRSLI